MQRAELAFQIKAKKKRKKMQKRNRRVNRREVTGKIRELAGIM